MPGLKRAMIGAVVTVLLTMAAGCSSRPQSTTDSLGAAPQDFTLDLTVLCGAEAEIGPEAHRKPGRFVIFPNGDLHYDSEPKRGADWLPDRTRTLDRRQMAEVWSLAQQLGFADPSVGREPVNQSLLNASTGETLYLIELAARNDRWAFMRRAPDDASVALIRLLAGLAWADERPDQRHVIAPRRYDFGPDPYARYREP